MALTTYTVTVTAGAANTKGAYTEIVAATPAASSRLHLAISHTGASPRFMLLDLATGAAGAETVVVANVANASDTENIVGGVITLAVDLPAGTRLAARCQSVTASTTVFVRVTLDDRALGGLTAPVTYGTNTAASRGTQIDPGATANTKGAWVELSASTTARIDVLGLCCTTNAQGAALTVTVQWAIDVGVGAGGAEVVVIPDLVVTAGALAEAVRPSLLQWPVAIPVSSRLAVRVAGSVTTATQRVLCVTLIGMQEPASGGGSGPAAVAYVG